MTSTPFESRSSEFPEDLPIWPNQNGPNNKERLTKMRRNLRSARQQELTPRQQQLLHLYYDEKRNMTEIANMLGINPSSVSRTIARARHRLNRCLRYTV
ncbi:MAG: sigma-70 family RNA polymerase sigma factor [Oscillibacter sp.]|nr:sigma-70 family RNA polymerase sigma factor [Oscillibacter sp.]